MPAHEISIGKFLLILRKHQRLIVGVFSACVLIAVAVTLLTPDIYRASTSVNFDFKSANPLGVGDRSLEEEAYLFTQIDIIKSQSVAQKVVNGLSRYERERLLAGLEGEKTIVDEVMRKVSRMLSSAGSSGGDESAPGSAGGGEREVLDVTSAFGWLARSAGYRVEAVPRFNSRIVDISYATADPQVAALMVNRFAEAYIATNLEMTIDPARKTSIWYDQQLKALRGKLEEAQSELTAYQQQEGIVSSDEQLDTENSRLMELSSQLVAAQRETRNAVTEQNKLREIFESGASLMTFEPVFSNPVVSNIKAEIRTLEGKLVELSSTYGKNHPARKRIVSELSAARGRLQAELDAITSGINNAAALAKSREDDLTAALAAQKQQVLDLKKEHDRIAVLQRKVESAQSTYNAALSQLNTASMQSLVDQTNVSVVDQANVPGRPSSPNLTKNVILSALAGLLLGLGLAILLEMIVRRVHSRDDLLLELGVPVLGHLRKI